MVDERRVFAPGDLVVIRATPHKGKVGTVIAACPDATDWLEVMLGGEEGKRERFMQESLEPVPIR